MNECLTCRESSYPRMINLFWRSCQQMCLLTTHLTFTSKSLTTESSRQLQNFSRAKSSHSYCPLFKIILAYIDKCANQLLFNENFFIDHSADWCEFSSLCYWCPYLEIQQDLEFPYTRIWTMLIDASSVPSDKAYLFSKKRPIVFSYLSETYGIAFVLHFPV